MTHPSDEILSALVDHDAVDALDVAHVEGCAACQARLEALRDVASMLAEPVAVPAHLREAAVAAALVETSGASGAIRRITTARRARARVAASSGRRISAASAAAALVVALGVGGWLVSQAGGTANKTSTAKNSVLAAGNAQTQSANPTPARPKSEGAQLGPVNVQDQAGSPSGAGTIGSAGIYNAGDIGDYSATEPIADRYREYAAGSTHDGSYMAVSPCPAPEDHAVVWHAELTYNGIEAYARVLFKSQTDRVLQVLSRTDCALVESQAI